MYPVAQVATRWLRKIIHFSAGEAAIQVLQMALAFYIVRHVGKSDYAYYTISNSMIALANMLCATGVAIGFRKLGGKLWNQHREYASLIASANRQRLRQSAFIFPLIGAITWFLLARQGAPPAVAGGLAILTLLVVFPDVDRAVKIEALLISDRWKTVQWQKLLVVLLRITLVFAMVFTIGLEIEQLLFAAAVAAFAGSWFVERSGRDIWSREARPDAGYTGEMQAMFRKTLPNALFAAVQGQLAVIVLGIVGSSTSMADLGAVTRLSALFIVPSAFVSNVFAPSFSKCGDRKKLILIYCGSLLSFLVFSVGCLLLVASFPDILLFMLGPNYSGLQKELILAASLALVLFGSRLFARLNQSKGWIDIDARWNIPATIAVLGIGMTVFDMATVDGALMLTICTRLPSMILRLVDGVLGLYQRE
jgi:hypothetical protein